MTEAIKVSFVIILIIILLRLKWDLGLVMFLSSILLGLLFQLGINGIVHNIYLTIIDPTTLQLMGIVVLVYVLSSILRRAKSMDRVFLDVYTFSNAFDYAGWFVKYKLWLCLLILPVFQV